MNEVRLTFEDRRWIFPRTDCVLLPIANTTAELMAGYLSDRLVESGILTENVSGFILGIDENEGQWGECERTM